MSTKVIRKNVEITTDDVRGFYDIEKRNDTYVVDLTLGAGWSRMPGAERTFERVTGQTLAQTGHIVARAMVRDLIEQSRREFVYVAIDDMPGFAEEMFGEHLMAGYDGTRGDGGPLYVVRCDNHEQAEEIVDRVRSIGTIEDGDRSFHPTVNNITNHALDALGGEPWNATEPLTFLAAQRAEDATVHVG